MGLMGFMEAGVKEGKAQAGLLSISRPRLMFHLNLPCEICMLPCSTQRAQICAQVIHSAAVKIIYLLVYLECTE